MCKYGVGVYGWVPPRVPTYRALSLCGVISNLGDESNEQGKALSKGVRLLIGEGNCVVFFCWVSGWEGVFFVVYFPRLLG